MTESHEKNFYTLQSLEQNYSNDKVH